MDNFKNFYIANKERLFNYLLRRTGDYYLSADLMQEAFAKYYERYRLREYSVSLLFTIGRNLLFDHLRGQRNATEYDDKQHGSTYNHEQTILIRDESRRVLNAIQKLSKSESDILSLAVSSGLSYREIGKITGNSEAKIKVTIHRSRLKLKKILEKDEKN